MDRKVFFEHYRIIEISNKILLALLVAESICMAIMAVAFYKYVGWQKVVLVPPTLTRQVEIAGEKTSPDYIRVMCDFIAGQVMEYTPHDIEDRIETILFYVPAKYRRDVKKSLDTLKDDIKRTGMAQMFRMEDMRIRNNGFAYILGNLERYVSHTSITKSWENQAKLRIQFYVEDGRFYLVSLKMVKGPFMSKSPDDIFRGFDEED